MNVYWDFIRKYVLLVVHPGGQVSAPKTLVLDFDATVARGRKKPDSLTHNSSPLLSFSFPVLACPTPKIVQKYRNPSNNHVFLYYQYTISAKDITVRVFVLAGGGVNTTVLGNTVGGWVVLF